MSNHGQFPWAAILAFLVSVAITAGALWLAFRYLLHMV
jgi:heme/copper-type cytochrome/quinol oxidase subunit 4